MPFKAWLSASAVGYGVADKADLRPRRKMRTANGCALGLQPGFRGILFPDEWPAQEGIWGICAF